MFKKLLRMVSARGKPPNYVSYDMQNKAVGVMAGGLKDDRLLLNPEM